MASSRGTEHRSGNIFKKIDVDSSGEISLDEWVACFNRMTMDNPSFVISRKEWTLLGGDNCIFDAICNKSGHRGVMNKRDWEDAFMRLDLDSNGVITTEEWNSSVASKAYNTLKGISTGKQTGSRARSPAPTNKAGKVVEDLTQEEGRRMLMEQLRLAAEKIQRNEKAVQERQARTQRAEWSYTNRINELKGQVKLAQESEKIVRARLSEKEEELKKLEEEESELTRRNEILELQLRAARQQKEKQEELQMKLNTEKEKAVKLENRLSLTLKDLRDRKGETAKGSRAPVSRDGAWHPIVSKAFEDALAVRCEEAQNIRTALGAELHGHVAGMPIGLFFAGKTMQKAQDSTNMLISGYGKGLKEKMKIIFISFDENEEAFNTFCKPMPWLVLPYNQKQNRERLAQILGIDINGMPRLVVLQQDGNVLTRHGLVKIQKDPTGASFPKDWSPQGGKAFADINNDFDGAKAQKCVVALWQESNKLAIACHTVAKAALAQAGGDANAMPFRFYDASSGEAAVQLRESVKVSGDKLLFLDFPDNGAFYVCDSEVTNADDVKQFIADVLQKNVERRQVVR